MPTEWVDFHAVKKAVSMASVLARYNVRLRKANSSYLRGKCPLPTHASKQSHDSFGTDLNKNIWACQSDSCVKARSGKKGGNVIDFVSIMERCSIRDAALKLQNWFSITSASAPFSEKQTTESKLVSERKGKGSDADHEPEQNRPLDFKLKGIDSSHEYIATRGITPETATTFGVGFFPGKGSMSGRIVIPIHNEKGELVAYAGRAIDDTEPRYKFPSGFHKSKVVFNLHRAAEKTGTTVVLVEGFFGCMKIWQSGFPSAALMGSSLSDEQEELVARFVTGAILLFDGDEAGKAITDECLVRLGRRMWVKALVIGDNEQPDHFDAERIRKLLE